MTANGLKVNPERETVNGKLRNIIRHFVERLISPPLLHYLSKDRFYRYDDIKLNIRAGVFHPGFFFSTKVMLQHLASFDLHGKSMLELGAGSGLISIFAARRGARVTASDISRTAVETIRENAERNQVNLSICHSDLFASIQPQTFDLIIINPPYYPADPAEEHQHAWFCGTEFQYFQTLFRQIGNFMSLQSTVLMVLSDACQLSKVEEIAMANALILEPVFRKRTLWEYNIIYRIKARPIPE